jgi:hypothetical protein
LLPQLDWVVEAEVDILEQAQMEAVHLLLAMAHTVGEEAAASAIPATELA